MAFNASLQNSLMKLVSHRDGTLSAISSSHQGQIPSRMVPVVSRKGGPCLPDSSYSSLQPLQRWPATPSPWPLPYKSMATSVIGMSSSRKATKTTTNIRIRRSACWVITATIKATAQGTAATSAPITAARTTTPNSWASPCKTPCSTWPSSRASGRTMALSVIRRATSSSASRSEAARVATMAAPSPKVRTVRPIPSMAMVTPKNTKRPMTYKWRARCGRMWIGYRIHSVRSMCNSRSRAAASTWAMPTMCIRATACPASTPSSNSRSTPPCSATTRFTACFGRRPATTTSSGWVSIRSARESSRCASNRCRNPPRSRCSAWGCPPSAYCAGVDGHNNSPGCDTKNKPRQSGVCFFQWVWSSHGNDFNAPCSASLRMPLVLGHGLVELHRRRRRTLGAQADIYQHHHHREGHGEIDVALRDVELEPLGDQRDTLQVQEAQREHLDGGVTIDEIAYRFGRDHHDAHRYDDGEYHDYDVVHHAHRGDDRIQRKNDVDDRDLHEYRTETHLRHTRGGRFFLFAFQPRMDFVHALP